MKYLHYILTLTLASCLIGIWGIPFIGSERQTDSTALVINQHSIPAAEIEARRENSSYHFEGRREFLEDLIIKELLIQEAQRQKIDQDESFRLTIKNYYEQSLIKTLLDRQYRALVKQFDEKSIVEFKDNFVCQYRLNIQRYPDQNSATNQQATSEQLVTSNYFDLPEDIRDIVVQLAPGEISEPIAAESHYIRVLLVTKNTITETPTNQPAEESINLNCEEELLRQAMNKWLNGLRNSARISLPKTYATPEN